MVLQSAAAVMLLIACVVRVATTGVDALAVVFGGLALVAAGAALLIRRRIRAMSS